MVLLSVENITKHFGPDPVLDGVSFEVRAGEKIGLVGPNGTGKTTLLKIIAGREQQDAGSVVVPGSARAGYLEQQPNFQPGRTLWEEAASALEELRSLGREAEQTALALSKASEPSERARLAARYDRLQHELHERDAWHLDHKIERVLDGLGFDRDSYQQPVGQLSGGQQNRLLLAQLLLAEPDLLLLDEPSNHLDIEATRWLENFLAESSQAVLVVSHDRYLLDRVTRRTLELFRGRVESYPGSFSAYWRLKAERLEVQRRTYEKQQDEIAKTEEFIRRNHYGQKHAQAKDREKKLARLQLQRVEPPREIAAPPMAFPSAARSGDIVLRVEELAKAYDRPLFAGLQFDVLRGQRWGILGPNGSGKTTLLRCIVGQERPDAGRVVLGAKVRVGYYDQLLHGLDDAQQVVEAIRPPHKEFTEPQRRDLLARFGLTGDQAFQPIGSLSGGERSRAALAQLAAADANFLVLDEPTNHLDLWARDALERALLEFDGTVLFVSHDRYFLNRVADHLLVLEPDGVRVVEGNYDVYLHLSAAQDEDVSGRPPPAAGRKSAGSDGKPSSAGRRAAAANGRDERAASAAAPRNGEPGGKAARPKRRFPYRKVDDLEAEIFERESLVEALHAEMLRPEVLRDGQRVRELQAQVAQQQATLQRLYEHWEEATELN